MASRSRAVIGLVSDAMRKSVSRRMESVPCIAMLPSTSTCVSPRRLTSATSPGTTPRSTYPASTSCSRPRRAADSPPVPIGPSFHVGGWPASYTVTTAAYRGHSPARDAVWPRAGRRTRGGPTPGGSLLGGLIRVEAEDVPVLVHELGPPAEELSGWLFGEAHAA